MKKLALAAALSSAFMAVPGVVLAQAAAAPAAEAPKSDWTITANVGLATDYRFRGISQSNKEPAISGGFDVGHASGFYIGNWDSSISWLADLGAGSISSNIETDWYGGYKGEIVKDLGFDVGYLYYYYPGTYPGGFLSPNTGELYGALSYGPVSAKLSWATTNLFGYTDSKNSWYLDVSASQDFGGISWGAHVGHQKVEGPSSDNCTYTDWKLGGSKDIGSGLSLGLNYIDTNGKDACYVNAFNKKTQNGTVVLSLSKTL